MILSSAKIRRDIRNKLSEKFPDETFIFCNGMNEAEEHLLTAEILITYGEDLTDELIEKAANLKWIMVISAGLDRMPFEAIRKKGILVTNARGIHKTPMAEYTIAMMLQVARQTKVLIAHEQERIWDRRVKMTEISGKTIGILGTGAIGCEIARLAKAFHMRTLGFNRSGHQADFIDEIYGKETLSELLKESDFLISVLPATPETYNFLTMDHFRQMKASSVFINIGRGTTINEEDLLKALKDGMIAHAVLDVFKNEPLHFDHPFWKMENVTVTPHLSGISPQYQERAITLFEENLKKYRNGEQNFINIIPLERGY